MVLVIDNYDSFTYNLVQYLGELDANVVVVRNDQLEVDALLALRPDRVVISPGPGRPEQAGVTLEIIRRAGERLPVLGVCLGHQAIGLAFGGTVVRARKPVHGKASRIEHDGRGLFAGIGGPFLGGRYHSLVVSSNSIPPELEVSARTADDEAIVMGLRHRTLPIHGVQFHPESVLTAPGRQMLSNFMAL
jgi:anthranilate synthase component 2